MKLTIKTLQQLSFHIDIEPEKSVKELKEQIEKEQGKDFPSSSQKLIYSGKILADENKLSEYEFDEKKFVVLMITRPPPAPKPAAAEQKTENKSTKVESEDKQKEQKTPQRTLTSSSSFTPVSATTAPSATISTTVANTTTTTTPQTTNTVSSNTTARSVQTPTSGRSSVFSDAAQLAVGEPQLASRLANLMSQPQFRQMQDLIQQSPHLLSSTIESVAASDPDMYNFISENPDIFVNALNHPPLAGSRATTNTTSSNQQHSHGSAQQTTAEGRQQSATELLNYSEHDKEAIERLKELGFSEYLAVQAYIACDKDEQLAANLLFQMEQ